MHSCDGNNSFGWQKHPIHLMGERTISLQGGCTRTWQGIRPPGFKPYSWGYPFGYSHIHPFWGKLEGATQCVQWNWCLTRISDVKTKNPCSIWVRHGTILWSDGILYSAGILSKNISKLRYVPSCWLLPPTRTCHLYYFVVLSASVVHLRMLSVASVTWQRCSDRWLKTAVGRLEMTSLGYNLEI